MHFRSFMPTLLLRSGSCYLCTISTWKTGPLPTVRDSVDVSVLRTFSNIKATAAAGIASSFLTRQAIWYVKAGGTARPSQYKSVPL